MGLTWFFSRRLCVRFLIRLDRFQTAGDLTVGRFDAHRFKRFIPRLSHAHELHLNDPTVAAVEPDLPG